MLDRSSMCLSLNCKLSHSANLVSYFLVRILNWVWSYYSRDLEWDNSELMSWIFLSRSYLAKKRASLSDSKFLSLSSRSVFSSSRIVSLVIDSAKKGTESVKSLFLY